MEPDSSMSYCDQEERRRVFWSIYILDNLCSSGRATPAVIGESQCRVQLPCDEISFRNREPNQMPTLDLVLLSQDAIISHPGNLTLVVLGASIIRRCAQHALHDQTKGESRLPPWDSNSEFAVLYSVLLQFETLLEIGSDLREVLRRDCLRNGVFDRQIAGPIIFSRALFHTSYCLLHHPFLLSQQSKARGIKAPPSFMSRAIENCREHANAMSDLMKEARSAGYTAFFSFMGYCVTVSGSVHALNLMDANPDVQNKARMSLQLVTEFLEEFSQHWVNGNWMVGTNKSFQSINLLTRT